MKVGQKYHTTTGEDIVIKSITRFSPNKLHVDKDPQTVVTVEATNGKEYNPNELIKIIEV